MRGDAAVPTLFNGNFDAVFDPKGVTRTPLSKGLPGWSFHNGQSNPNIDLVQSLEEVKLIQGNSEPNYAFKLESSGVKEIVHNRFVVPDWGALRFDLHAPKIANSSNAKSKGTLDVTIRPSDPSIPAFSQTITLQKAENQTDSNKAPASYLIDQFKVDYGIKGFESFSVDVPEKLRGQPATVEFKLEASIPVYLDNVFFQSESLRFSNPTTARTDLVTNNTYQNNYLIEKPQYTVSYNGKKNTPNWVSWVLDGSWPGNIKSKDRPGEFAVDPDLNSSFYRVAHKDYKFDSQINYNEDEYKAFKLEQPAIFWPVRGHMSASNDRNRSTKDMYASFLTTNIVPQDSKGNEGAWRGLEDKLQKLARLKNEQKQPTPYKFYISSGVYGAGGGELTKYSTPPTVTVLNERGRVVEAPLKDNPNSFKNFKTADGDRTITVPSALWKVVLGFKPNSTSDKPDYYFAFWMPNNSYEIQKSLDYTTKDAKGNIIVKNNTLGWEERLIPIGKLEERLNADLEKSGDSFKYDFLSQIKDPNSKDKMKKIISLLP